MATYILEPSKTLGEFLLLPNLTTRSCQPQNVSLETPLVRFKKGEEPELTLNTPFVSACMQSVSGEQMAIALAKEGGLAFIFGSQSISDQANMVAQVKKYKAGFVVSDSNVKPTDTLAQLMKIVKKTRHSTVAVTEDGTGDGKLLGLVTDKDYRPDHTPSDAPVSSFMTAMDKLVTAPDGITLSQANDLIWKHRLNCLPILSKDGNLKNLVFRKDYETHKENKEELLDEHKRYLVGAAVNTRDYAERIPALVKAGADVLCIDSSDGFSEWQSDVLAFVRKKYGNKVKIGAGNVVDKEGFYYLAKAGADFIKVGVGGGSICITREQKGIGRGQASALIDVVEARNEYYQRTGEYIPICNDGGIVHDNHIIIALAMGSDFVMMGRYFARFDESPSRVVSMNGSFYKEYWGEGSSRARNWQRYDSGGSEDLMFEEGVDSYIPYAGKLGDTLKKTVYKIKSTMCNCGSPNLMSFAKDSRLTVISPASQIEGGAHDVMLKNSPKT